jgi:hypothetical protein
MVELGRETAVSPLNHAIHHHNFIGPVAERKDLFDIVVHTEQNTNIRKKSKCRVMTAG